LRHNERRGCAGIRALCEIPHGDDPRSDDRMTVVDDRSITQSLNHSITQSLNHSITQSLNQLDVEDFRK
jgi:hypothetical protein